MKFLPHSCFFTSIFCSKCCFTFVLFGVAAVLLRLWTPMRSCVRVENPLRRNPWRTTMETFAVALAIAILFRWKASEKRKGTFAQLKMKGSPNWLIGRVEEGIYKNVVMGFPVTHMITIIQWLCISRSFISWNSVRTNKTKKHIQKGFQQQSSTIWYSVYICMHICTTIHHYIYSI